MSAKKRKRRLAVKGNKETPAQRQQRTAVKFVMNNPQYPLILRSIRDGSSNSRIAEFCIDRGFFDVNEKTAVSYLQYFKRAHPGLCKPQPPEEGGVPGYDYAINETRAIIDEEIELDKLIALQKARLGISFKNERNIGAVLDGTRKDVEELRNLLMDKAKLRGLVGNSVDVNLHGYSDTVKSNLRSVDQDEVKRGSLASLVSELAQVVSRD